MGKKEKVVLSDLSGNFQASWYNPRDGKFAGKEKAIKSKSPLDAGTPPSEPEMDWVLLIRKK